MSAAIGHDFKPYPSATTNPLSYLVGVCCECGDYHDGRRTRTAEVHTPTAVLHAEVSPAFTMARAELEAAAEEFAAAKVTIVAEPVRFMDARARLGRAADAFAAEAAAYK